MLHLIRRCTSARTGVFVITQQVSASALRGLKELLVSEDLVLMIAQDMDNA